jgi:TonB-dependent receptor
MNTFSGNAELTPVIADNFDLMVEQKVGQSGLISVAGFYKTFSDLIVDDTETISSGDLSGYQSRSFKNSDNTASIFGAEFSVSQKLTFLPGVLNNLGFYGNYTWSQSNYETERGDETDIPGHSPHVVNAALNYSIGRLFAQVNYHWSAELLTELQDRLLLAPSAASGPVYRDRYEDGYQDVSATLNFQLSERFRFWAHLSNLLPSDKIEYAYDKEYYPTSRYVRNGLEVRAGIRYDL